MTITEVLDLAENHIEVLQKMDDKTLHDHLAPYLIVTRPDLAAANRTTKKKVASRKHSGSEDEVDYDAAKQIAMQFGFRLNI